MSVSALGVVPRRIGVRHHANHTLTSKVLQKVSSSRHPSEEGLARAYALRVHLRRSLPAFGRHDTWSAPWWPPSRPVGSASSGSRLKKIRSGLTSLSSPTAPGPAATTAGGGGAGDTFCRAILSREEPVHGADRREGHGPHGAVEAGLLRVLWGPLEFGGAHAGGDRWTAVRGGPALACGCRGGAGGGQQGSGGCSSQGRGDLRALRAGGAGDRRRRELRRQEIEEVYRFGLIERLIAAVAARISRAISSGASRPRAWIPERRRGLWCS